MNIKVTVTLGALLCSLAQTSIDVLKEHATSIFRVKGVKIEQRIKLFPEREGSWLFQDVGRYQTTRRYIPEKL
jgi:hypothetical protein